MNLAGLGVQRSILIVDDDISACRFLESLLNRAGYGVRTAAEGREAARAISTGSFDVVVSDISMPDMTGIDLLRSIRAHDLDVPVILVTGDPNVDTAVQAVDHGAIRYITKPFQPQVLLDAITHALQMRDLARAKRDALTLVERESKEPGDLVDLREAFGRAVETLRMVYQPIINCSEQEVFGYEALLRTDEPLFHSPAFLLHAAERLGCVEELGRAIRARVAKESPRLTGDQLLFVNVHPRELADQSLYEPSSPLSEIADKVVLEVTERAQLDMVGALGERTAALRGLGYRFAVDDLGAGYAGLSSFVHLHPEVVKLDMILVRKVHEDPRKAKLVRCMRDLCGEMGVTVIAEGVETKNEYQALIDLGVDLLQGNFFASPSEDFLGVSLDMFRL